MRNGSEIAKAGVFLNASYYADNLEAIAVEPEHLADHGLILEIVTDERLIDDHEFRRIRAVAGGEQATFEQGDAQSLEEPRSDVDVIRRLELVLARKLDTRIQPALIRQRQACGGGFDSRRFAKTLDRAIEQLADFLRRPVARVLQGESRGHDVIRIEAGVDVPQMQKRMQQKSGADQQRDSQGDLPPDERSERQEALASGDGSRAGLHGSQVNSRCLPGRNQSKSDASNQRQHQRDRKS